MEICWSTDAIANVLANMIVVSLVFFVGVLEGLIHGDFAVVVFHSEIDLVNDIGFASYIELFLVERLVSSH